MVVVVGGGTYCKRRTFETVCVGTIVNDCPGCFTKVMSRLDESMG